MESSVSGTTTLDREWYWWWLESVFDEAENWGFKIQYALSSQTDANYNGAENRNRNRNKFINQIRAPGEHIHISGDSSPICKSHLESMLKEIKSYLCLVQTGHVDIEEFRWGRKGERHTTCNIVWNMERSELLNIYPVTLSSKSSDRKCLVNIRDILKRYF